MHLQYITNYGAQAEYFDNDLIIKNKCTNTNIIHKN